jgi:uncharacterized protein HemX
MTTLLSKPDTGTPWSAMPGWGIVADLTPPELVAARRLKVLQRYIAAGLATVVLLCAAGYAFAYVKNSSASDAVDAANARTTDLTAQQSKYAAVTQLKATTTGITSQTRTLMATDVDMAGLLGTLRRLVPATMALTAVTVSTTPAAAGSTPSLDGSARPTIGTITLTGSSHRLVDLASYVSRLSALPGVVDVVPSSNTAGSANVATWNVSLQITDLLYTHRYDVQPVGSR